jgi:hypothetical protein
MTVQRCIFAITLLALPSLLRAAEPLDAQVSAFLEAHCLECHGAEKPKKGFRVDTLGGDFAHEANRRQWLAALKRIKSGEMPPKSKPRPLDDEIKLVGDWVTRQEEAAAPARAAQGRVVLRRLNRVEYENTIKDLLGIVVELKDLLPPDSSADGFDNVGEALHLSSFQMERYLEAADKALNLAIVNAPQPPLFKKQLRCQDTHTVKLATEKVYRTNGEALVLFSSSPWNAITVSQFYPPDRGNYRFRISASAFQSDDKPVTYRIEAGPMLMGTKNHLIGYFDAPPGEPTVVEFTDFVEARSTIRIQPFGIANAQTVDKIGADKYEGPGLEVQWIEIEGPLHDAWPPESHRRIFGDLPQDKQPKQQHLLHVVSSDPSADARQILLNFTRRAYRRRVTEDDVKPLVAVVERKMADGYSFEEAIRVGLKGALVSPEFLFLREKPGQLDDFALASRLSYFLWSTMPDEELLALAEQGKLRDAKALREQVERMLASPKSAQFTENFVDQWLGLREIDFTEPDRLLYPEYDDMLRAAMVEETHRFFREVLEQDLSLTNFVASDFTFLNERLAKHYNIPDVKGHNLRKVKLPPDCHRGGVMTMASVLKVTANGTSTSPVVRGAWVLSRILGTPPEPPPGDVPAIEPDIRGATTIREQLAKHRAIESCSSCHVKIDPPGFALESFDVIGLWRENYRSLGRGEPVTINGQRMHYAKSPAVDPSDILPDGRKFANIDELKQLLLQEKDQLARALTMKLVTYATGRGPQPSDQAEIEAIVARIRDKDYGLKTLVHQIVMSRLFLEK